jgi:serine/threonine-protein kinase
MTTADFVAVLRPHRLLEPAQLEELQDLQVRFADPKALAKELVQRGWLTIYHVNQIGKEHAAELRPGTYVVLERLGEGGMGAVLKSRRSEGSQSPPGVLPAVVPRLLFNPLFRALRRAAFRASYWACSAASR